MLPDEERSRPDIAAVLNPYTAEMNRLLNVALTLIPASGFKATRSARVDQIVVYTIIGLYVKALKTFRAIQVVCEAGLTQDAIALLRVQFETTVAILFILQRNTRLRARMYHARIYVKRLGILRTWKGRKGLKRKVTKDDVHGTEAALLKILNGLTAMKRWPAKHWYTPRLPAAVKALGRARRTRTGVSAEEREAIEALVAALGNHFSGRSIWDAANALRWMTAYETLYRYTTFFGHAEDFHHHVTIKDDGGMVLKLIPAADADTVRTMETASLFLWSVATAMDKHFETGHGTALESVKPAIADRTKARKRSTPPKVTP
jgi:hypothetical protein